MRLHQLSSRSDNSGSSSRSSPSIVSGPFPSRRTSGDVSPYIILQLESIDLKLWVLLSPISGISRRYCVLRLPIAVPDPFRPLSLVPLFELRTFITIFGIFSIFGFLAMLDFPTSDFDLSCIALEFPICQLCAFCPSSDSLQLFRLPSTENECF